MKKEHWITTLSLIICWFLLSFWIGHDIILPSPLNVFESMKNQLFHSEFFSILFITGSRMMKGLMLAFLSSLILILLENRFPQFKEYFVPIEKCMKTIPNITYILIFLIWFGQEHSVTAVLFFILFPIFYSSLSLALNDFHQKTDELLSIYPVTNYDKNIKLLLPMMFPVLMQSLKLGFGFGLKVTVMAEIMNEAQGGVGRQMSLCRRNLDSAGIFAWTIWILIIGLFVEIIFSKIIKIYRKGFNYENSND